MILILRLEKLMRTKFAAKSASFVVTANIMGQLISIETLTNIIVGKTFTKQRVKAAMIAYKDQLLIHICDLIAMQSPR